MPAKQMSDDDAKDLQLLRELVLKHVSKGEVSRRVVDYLFDVYGSPERVVANDITMNGGPQSDANVAAHMTKLREQLWDLFDYDPEGRSSRFRVVLTGNDKGNYAMVREPNLPPTDVLSRFWYHHFMPIRTQVVYPELLCTCHQAAANHSNLKDGERIANSDLIGSLDTAVLKHSLVSSSSVRSVLRLFDCFQTWQVPLSAVAVPPSTIMVEGNLIALATPRTMPQLLPNLEATVPIKTGHKGVTINGGKDTKMPTLFVDTPENAETPQGTELIKWVVLTRHHYRFQRTMTVIGAKDELAGEAVIQVLTNETAILMLARELKCRAAFPDHFQSLFAVHIVKGHPYARSITIELVIDLGGAA